MIAPHVLLQLAAALPLVLSCPAATVRGVLLGLPLKAALKKVAATLPK